MSDFVKWRITLSANNGTTSHSIVFRKEKDALTVTQALIDTLKVPGNLHDRIRLQGVKEVGPSVRLQEWTKEGRVDNLPVKVTKQTEED